MLNTLVGAVYEAREGPPSEDLKQIRARFLKGLRELCETIKGAPHEKASALGSEFLNDWEAIFAMLSHPHLPLINNEAEWLLRHLVILGRITYGTRSRNETRALALLASVVETCRRQSEAVKKSPGP
ncbi:MAG: Transposase IS66 family protein [Candidatus Kentron sp. G]|nr:MAG: Transposase IS66 family protein [Candidatus Kentron sp. G]VFN05853.1 MAG: Transposase IS66 family protein [Candidatus Kentron sp. G]VFN07186.1 MAG: Transposase IS66 family protein [Candidatus Kentron sp. G]